MATGTYVIEVDWNNDGTFTGSGETVTSRTLHVDCFRGRDVDSQLTGRSIAGTCQLILNNQSGDYNSYNSTSPLTGSIVPGRLVQIRATGPTAGTLWKGYIDRIIPKPSAKGLDTVVIECIGPLGFVNLKEVSISMLTDVRAGTVIGSILDQAGWPTGTAYRDLDTGTGTAIRRIWFFRTRALDAMREVEVTESGFLRESGDGKIVFEDRHRRMKSPYQTSQATFSDSSTGTLTYLAVEQEDPLPFIFSEFAATVMAYTTGTLGTLWKLQDTGTFSPLLRVNGTLTLWAKHPNATSTINAIGVDSWTTPTATVDYNIFTDSAGTGTNLNSAVAVTVGKFGSEMSMLFNNTGTRDGFLTLVQARGIPLLESEATVVSTTGTSTAFGTRTYPSPAKFIPNLTEAKDWADWNLSIYKDPIVRFNMTFVANRNDAHLTQAILREVSDRVTLVATSTRSNLGLARRVNIEALRHVIEADRTHNVTYYLSDGGPFSDGWVLDTSELGTTTKLAF